MIHDPNQLSHNVANLNLSQESTSSSFPTASIKGESAHPGAGDSHHVNGVHKQQETLAYNSSLPSSGAINNQLGLPIKESGSSIPPSPNFQNLNPSTSQKAFPGSSNVSNSQVPSGVENEGMSSEANSNTSNTFSMMKPMGPSSYQAHANPGMTSTQHPALPMKQSLVYTQSILPNNQQIESKPIPRAPCTFPSSFDPQHSSNVKTFQAQPSLNPATSLSSSSMPPTSGSPLHHLPSMTQPSSFASMMGPSMQTSQQIGSHVQQPPQMGSHVQQPPQMGSRVQQPPQMGSHVPQPPQMGSHVQQPPQMGSHVQQPPQMGSHVQQPPQMGSHVQQPPQMGSHVQQPPQMGSHVQQPPQMGSHVQQPPQMGSHVQQPPLMGLHGQQSTQMGSIGQGGSVIQPPPHLGSGTRRPQYFGSPGGPTHLKSPPNYPPVSGSSMNMPFDSNYPSPSDQYQQLDSQVEQPSQMHQIGQPPKVLSPMGQPPRPLTQSDNLVGPQPTTMNPAIGLQSKIPPGIPPSLSSNPVNNSRSFGHPPPSIQSSYSQPFSPGNNANINIGRSANQQSSMHGQIPNAMSGMHLGQMPPPMSGSSMPGPQMMSGAPPLPGNIPSKDGRLSQPMSGYPNQGSMLSGGMMPNSPTITGTGMSAQPGMMPGNMVNPMVTGSNVQHMPGRAPIQPSVGQRRLHLDDMPSPIQVIEDDKKLYQDVFYTLQKGLVPPLVTTPIVIEDKGNASPRFIRSTMYSIPETPDMMKQVGVPFALCITPFAELGKGEAPIPVVDNGELGPVRCNRCLAYMCPFMQFIDGGRRFQCAFCKATTEVPPEYFQHLDQMGHRIDWMMRPELHLGTYEIIATKMYCNKETLPKPPALIFLIDVSFNNIRNGLVNLLCANIKEMLSNLSVDEQGRGMKVGFITYNNAIHFYNNNSCLVQPQMLVVSDVQDVFMPLLDGFFCDPWESEAIIDGLLEQIPIMFGDTRETETVLGSAIQAGLEALKAAERAGKLIVFHSSLPTADAPGKLKNRDERKLLGTEKEKIVLTPKTTFYNNLGQDCVIAGCSVDLFIFNNAFVDLATIGQVSRLTGGHIYKYTYFEADQDGECFLHDLKSCIKHLCAFDATTRVRTSTGVRPVDFFGHFFMSDTTNIQFASLDKNKSICVEVKHDDKLTEEDGVYVQVATLYTSCGGQRKLRIMSLSLNIASQLVDVYKFFDLNTIINYFSKAAISKISDSTPKALRDGLIHRCAVILSTYRNRVANPSTSGQLILPECLKLLPLYLNCLLKSDALAGGSDLTIDERAFLMFTVQSMDVLTSMNYFYPRLIPLIDIETCEEDIPIQIRCSAERLKDDGVYLLENGITMFLWIGLNVPTEYISKLFGVQSPAQINIDQNKLPELNNDLSARVRSVIRVIREERHRFMKLVLVRQRDKLDIVFRHFLCEDGTSDLKMSYVDFLCLMHREIRSLLG